MPTPPRSPASTAAALAAALACPAAHASATEHARLEPLWIDAAAPGGGAAGRTVPALLNVPPAWMVGDAAVLVLSDGPWPGLARERLVAGLLGEAAAVLELDVAAARGSSPGEEATGPQATTAGLLPDVRAAVATLRRDAGAGLVVRSQGLGHARVAVEHVLPRARGLQQVRERAVASAPGERHLDARLGQAGQRGGRARR